MKKTLSKKIVSLMLAGLIFLSTALVASAFEAKNDENYEDEELILQLEAQDALSELNSSFKIGDGYFMYPDDFAGTWYENGILHVVLTDKQSIPTYKNILKRYKCVVYETAEYSLNELDSIRFKLFDIIKGEYNIISNVVDNKENKIYFGIKDLGDNVNEVKEFIITKALESGIIRECLYEKHNPNIININDFIDVCKSSIPKLEANIIGGMYSETDVYYFTVGVCGSFTISGTSYDGFVTSGHALSNNTDIYVNHNSTVFGKTKKVYFQANGNGDYALVRKTSSDTLTNKIYGSSSSYVRYIVGTLDDITQGMTVKKWGAISNYAQATCLGTNFSYYNNDIQGTVYGLTYAELTSGTSADGDSGGPYYVKASNGGSYDYNFVGVHHGSDVGYGYGWVWFTPYVRFKSYFTPKTS